jgi:Ca2+-binding RTX toxin-like protein
LRILAVVVAVVAATASSAAEAGERTVGCLGARATIVGTAGADLLRGTAKPDVIAGLGGADRVLGLGGNDLLCGGPGDDRIDGGAGLDRAEGGTGHNDCTGVERRSHCAVARSGLLTIRVEGVLVSDDDGGRAAAVTPAQFATWIARANEVYAPGGIRFAFDRASDWATLRSTVLNNTNVGLSNAGLIVAKDEVARHRGKVVVILRHGPGRDATNIAYGSPELGFVVAVGYDQPTVLTGIFSRGIGTLSPWPYLIAHEIGHVLGLMHTHPGNGAGTDTIAKAWPHVAARGASALDGDGIADTPPDAGAGIYVNEGWHPCTGPPSYAIAGITFTPDRLNLMSYFGCGPARLTPGQFEVARRGARRFAG